MYIYASHILNSDTDVRDMYSTALLTRMLYCDVDAMVIIFDDNLHEHQHNHIYILMIFQWKMGCGFPGEKYILPKLESSYRAKYPLDKFKILRIEYK